MIRGVPARLRAALPLALLAACGPAPIHVRSITLDERALSPPLREVGLDEGAIAEAARVGLRAAGFRMGDGKRPHDALVSVPALRLVAGRAEVAVEIALASAEPGRVGPSRNGATASVPLAGAATPREAWLAALSQAARGASEALALAFAADAKPDQGLVSDLAADDARVREQAIRVLGERKSRAAVPALIARLDDGEPRLAHRAVAALAQIGDERAVPALIELARSADPELAARLVRYVGDIGGAEAEGFLLTVEAGHPERRVRAAARGALEDMRERAREAPVAAK